MALRFLVQVTDKYGRRVARFVEAERVELARKKLEGEGATQIEFFDTEFSAGLPGSKSLDPEIALRVMISQKIRHSPGGALATLRQIFRTNWKGLVAGFAIAACGLYLPDWRLVALIIPYSAIWLGLAVYASLPSQYYQEVIKAECYGDLARMEKFCALMEKRSQGKPSILLEIVRRRANAMAKTGELEKALRSVEIWRSQFDEPRGRYSSTVAGLYARAEKKREEIDFQRLACDESGQDATQVITLAQALSKYNRLDEAEAVLASVKVDNLTQQARNFMLWISGRIKLKRGQNDAALNELSLAVANFSKHASSPAHWAAFAYASGELAVAMAWAGERKRAAQMVLPLMPIIRNLSDKPLVRLLEKEVLNEANHAKTN